MLANIAKWGNSLALRISSAFTREIGLCKGTSVDISVTDGMLVRPVEDRHIYDLEALLSGIMEENRYGGLVSGKAVGNEFQLAQLSRPVWTRLTSIADGD